MARTKKEIFYASLVLCAALGAMLALIKTRPKVPEKASTYQAPLVETVGIEKQSPRVIITAEGKVEAAVSLHIQAEVSGKIRYKHPQLKKGGTIAAGDILIILDSREYELALAQKKAALARAKLDLDIEIAQQQVADAQYERRSKDERLSGEAEQLARRLPYLSKAKHDYAAAEAEVERAELTLARTHIRAPINAIVSQSSAELGEMVFSQTPIATLTGIDEFLAELNIPVADLSYIDFSKHNKRGSLVEIEQLSKNGTSIRRQGHVKSLLPQLGSLGHMARIVVSIPKPLSLEQNTQGLPLLAGALVSAHIQGKVLENVLAIPRKALSPNDEVIIVNEHHRLMLKKLAIIYRDQNSAYIRDGLDAKSRLLITKLANFADGTEVRLSN